MTSGKLNKIKKKIKRSFLGKPVNLRGDIIALHQYKALYFAIPKVANTSLKMLVADILKDKIPNEYLFDDYGNYRPKVFWSEEGRNFLKKNNILISPDDVGKYSHYFKFAFVRNPFSRVTSFYKQKIKSEKITDEKLRVINGVKKGLYRQYGEKFYGGMPFSECVRKIYFIKDQNANLHFLPQHRFITFKNKFCVDFVGKLEDFNDDLLYIKEKIGLPSNIEPTHMLSSNNNDYKRFYNPILKKMVQRRYKKDLKLLNYEY